MYICTQPDRDFKDLEFSGGAGAGIPCICCEQHKVLGEVFWVWTDSMGGSCKCLTICALINPKISEMCESGQKTHWDLGRQGQGDGKSSMK